MNQGVEILLARMESNPDEFSAKYGSKWLWVLEGVNARVANGDKTSLPFLNDEEITTLWAKLVEISRDGFTKKVMATLLPEEEKQFYGQSAFGAAPVRGEGQPVTIAGITNQALKILNNELSNSYGLNQYIRSEIAK